jgi:hypothetical protein
MVKMMAVDATLFESVGYVMSKRQLLVKFRNSPTMCYEGVPGFRYQGLLSAPRKDAYFKTYIQNQFLTKEVPSAPG